LTDSCQFLHARTKQNNVKLLPISWKSGSKRLTLLRRLKQLHNSFCISRLISTKKSPQIMSTEIF